MAKTNATAKDRDRFARARARGRSRVKDPSTVVDARYDPVRNVIDLAFHGGGSMSVPGLEEARASDLGTICVSAAGDALSWPSLDINVYVPGLVERAFGTRLFAAATGRRGGQRKTRAKTAAAKANGAKGGRPRKELSV